MDKAEYNKILQELLIQGLNLKYSSVSTRSRDSQKQELINILLLEPSILDYHEQLNARIVDVIFDNYKKEIFYFLKKNQKKIEQSKETEGC
jgi:hypothetical protein